MTQPVEQNEADQKMAAKRNEVFVGGLPKSISEEAVRELFTSCGEITQIRIGKDAKGNLKGFCFVKFSTKEAAARAISEKSGTVLDGKKIGVVPSNEQDTLFFGNLKKAWNAEDFRALVLQVFLEVEFVDLAIIKETTLDQTQQNRGFAFVKFASYAAAARALRVGSQPDFRLGNVHPVVQWADEGNITDPEELAKVKIAFVRNLPIDADENYVKNLFEPFGQIEKVSMHRKGRAAPIGFVHFTERSGLDKAITELNDKAVQGPDGGIMLKLEVEVAKTLEKKRKRANESSYAHGHSEDSMAKQRNALSNNDGYHRHREVETADPYLDVVISLPSAIKERLVRILRLGIATRFDIEMSSLHSLKELPVSVALSILDQFMLTAASLPNKGAYLYGLICNSLGRLPNPMDTSNIEPKLFNYSPDILPATPQAHPSRPDIHATMYQPQLLQYPYQHANARYLLTQDNYAAQSHMIPGFGLRNTDTDHLSPSQVAQSSSYLTHGPNSRFDLVRPAGGQESRPPLRFDPFTGEPFRFDPFTGEPIQRNE